MTRSSEEIEREVEASRADLDQTIEALKSKMSPGQLIDELTSSFKGSGSSEMFTNLGSQVKENPMAIALIGAGVAWLMSGKSQGAVASEGGTHRPTYSPFDGQDGGASASGRHGLGDFKDKASDAVHAVGDKAGQAGDRIKDGASAATDHVLDGVHALGASASDISHKARQTFFDTLDKEPLVIGALGLAVGVAIGAALPSTALEDRTFGAARDNLLDEAKTRAAEGVDHAREAAAAVVEGVRATAEEEGLLQEGDSVADKAKTLLQAGVDAAKDSFGQHDAPGSASS